MTNLVLRATNINKNLVINFYDTEHERSTPYLVPTIFPLGEIADKPPGEAFESWKAPLNTVDHLPILHSKRYLTYLVFLACAFLSLHYIL